MKSVGFCTASFRYSVSRAVGVTVPLLLSPPVCIDTFHPRAISHVDFLYVKLHGLPNQPYWYGDDWLTACSAAQVRSADLQGATVFVASCWGLDEEGQPGDMVKALFEAGARYVVAGPGENFARAKVIDAADKLGLLFRSGLTIGLPVKAAFRLAMGSLGITRPKPWKRLSPKEREALQDTLLFELLDPERAFQPPPFTHPASTVSSEFQEVTQ